MGAEAAGVHHPLGNALVVEMEDLFAEVKVFEQRRPAGSGAQGVLIVRYRRALGGGQNWSVAVGDLVRLAAAALGRVIGPARRSAPLWRGAATVRLAARRPGGVRLGHLVKSQRGEALSCRTRLTDPAAPCSELRRRAEGRL